jgi:hypothetical protein
MPRHRPAARLTIAVLAKRCSQRTDRRLWRARFALSRARSSPHPSGGLHMVPRLTFTLDCLDPETLASSLSG